jgi:hypothetical protein
MMDEADRAEEAIENRIDDGIAHARHMIELRSIKPCGSCHYCNSRLNSFNDLFCDKDCASDWDWEQRQKRIHGK